MRPHSLLPLALSGFLLASPAALAGPAPAAPQSAGPGRLWSPPPNEQLSRFEREEQRRELNMTEEEAEAEYGEERLELARRVAELVEQGKCRDARAMAAEAGERQMALRIRQTCRAR